MKKALLFVTLLIFAFSLSGCVPGPSKTTVIQVPVGAQTPREGVNLDVSVHKTIK